jgi:hypothetical protein
MRSQSRQINLFATFSLSLIGIRAATEPAGVRIHLRAGISHCDTVILEKYGFTRESDSIVGYSWKGKIL